MHCAAWLNAVGKATKGKAGALTVSISKPARVVTAEAEAEMLTLHPELAVTQLDRDRAKAEYPDLFDELRQPIGARRLTIKESK